MRIGFQEILGILSWTGVALKAGILGYGCSASRFEGYNSWQCLDFSWEGFGDGFWRQWVVWITTMDSRFGL